MNYNLSQQSQVKCQFQKEKLVNCLMQQDMKQQTDMPAILNAISSMENRMKKEFMDMKTRHDSIFKQGQEEIGKIKADFNTRMDRLAKKIEKQVCESLSKDVDKKINKHEKEIEKKTKGFESSLKSVREKVKHLEETVIPTINERLGDEIDEVTRKCDQWEGSQQDKRVNNNFIVRNLPERENENTACEVIKILRDGLKFRDIAVESAVRKQNRQDDRKPGIIMVTCKSKEDKQTIMKSKRHLKDTRRYEKVFIENDLPKSQRVLNSNLRTIVRTIGSDKLKVKGSYVSVRETDSRRPEQRPRHDLQ